MFVTFFGFQITSSVTNPNNQLDLITEKDIDELLSEKEKLLKGKTAYALELCKTEVQDRYGNNVNTNQVLSNSPTSVVISLNVKSEEVKVYCSISYDTTKVELFHRL